MKTIHSFSKLISRCWLVLLLLAGTSLINNASASHMVGADMSYTCTTTPGLWHIKLVFYRDCSGIPVCWNGCNSACQRTVSYEGADPACNGNSYGSISLNLTSVSDVNPNPQCPNAKSICDNMGCVTPGSYTPGIEKYTFEGDVDLGPTSGIPASCCNIRLVFQEQARNGAIQTGSANQNFYIESIINRCLSLSPCNSSPELSNDPFAVICGGQPYVFNNGALDPDHDSLTYEFTPALQGAGLSVSYTAPWSFDWPMPAYHPKNGPFPLGMHCDPLTGDISFTPDFGAGGPFVGVMAIEIKQWIYVNGVPVCIGKTRRDIQMWLFTCPPNTPPHIMTDPPLVVGNTLQPKLAWSICAGNTLCFDIIGKDTDFYPFNVPPVSDTTYLSWNAALASKGATFISKYPQALRKVNGPREDVWTFCWTPKDADASNLPYYFTVTVRDSRCPNPGKSTRAVSILVLAKADVKINKVDLRCGKWKVYLKRNKPSQTFISRLWNVSKVPNEYTGLHVNTYVNVDTIPIQNFTIGGKYLIELIIKTPGPVGEGPCEAQFYDTLTVDTTVAPFVPDTFVCVGSTVTIPFHAKWGTPTYIFKWFLPPDTLSPLNGPFLSVQTYNAHPLITTRYNVEVIDIYGCRSWDTSVIVTVKPLPVFLPLDSQRICNGSSYAMDLGNNNGNVKRYLWNTGNPADTLRTLTRNDSNSYILQLTDTFNCKNKDTFRLYVNAPIPADAGPDTAICFKDTATLHASGGQLYEWKNLANNTIILPKGYDNVVKVHPTVDTKYEVRVYASYPDTANKILECSQVDTVQVRVNPLPVLTRPTAVQVCKNSDFIALNSFICQGQPGGTGIWSYPPAPGGIIPGAVSQVKTDSLKFVPLDTINYPANTGFTNWINYKYTAPLTFGGCTSYDSAIVKVYGVPYVIAGYDVTWCKNGGPFKLQFDPVRSVPYGAAWKVIPADGTGNIGVWTGPGVITVPLPPSSNKRYEFDPTKALVVPAANILTYTYTQQYQGTGAPSCVGFDTVVFKVIDIPNISAGTLLPVCSSDPPFNIVTRASASDQGGNGGFWTPVPVTPKYGIDAAVKDSQNFNPAAVSFPAGQSQYSWRLIYSDISTGCPARDTTSIIVAQSPTAKLNLALTDRTVCRLTGNRVLNATWNPAGGAGIYSSDPSTSAYAVDMSDPPKSNFNTNDPTLIARQYLLKYAYTITVSGGSNVQCKTADSVLITVEEPPTLIITTRNLAICAKDSVFPPLIMNVTPAAIYTSFYWTHFGSGHWLNGDNTHLQATYVRDSLKDISAGKIKILASTNKINTCPIVQDSVYLNILPQPVADFTCDNCDGCEPLDAVLTAKPAGVPVKWDWTVANVKSDSPTVRLTIGHWGKYTAQLKVSSTTEPPCSETSLPQTIKVHATPHAEFSSTPPVTTVAKPYFDFDNHSSSPDDAHLTYIWNFGPETPGGSDRTSTDENPKSIGYSTEGEKCVKLKATTEFGCWDTTRYCVRIDPDITVFIPNAFYPGSNKPCPNGDQNCNRVFKPAASGYLTIEIYIFNRWGQQVYFSTDANEGWNGNMDGKETGVPCQQDVYIYQINATSFSGKAYKYSGSITLLR